jgi:hypothetical protein
MLRRADHAGYHYLVTEKKGWAPSVGEEGKLMVEGRKVNWTIVEIFKDHTTQEGVDVFTVRVDETQDPAEGLGGA